eukprot:PhF_6_TR31163/c0_g1_i1/m.45681
MMETILNDYAELMRRQASAVAFESLFRHVFVLQTNGTVMTDDMLWFVRLPPQDAKLAEMQTAPKSVGASATLAPSITDEVAFVRRHTRGKPLDSDIVSEEIDWARTIGLNIVVHWKYELVLAMVPQRKPVPGKGMCVKHHIRREVFASPHRAHHNRTTRETDYKLDFPNIYFYVDDFEDAFSNFTLSKGNGLALAVDAGHGLVVFKGVLIFDQICDTFERKAGKLKLNHTEYVPLVGPGRKGKSEMSIGVSLHDGATKPSREKSNFSLLCKITFVSIDFVALSMALLSTVEDTYIPEPKWLYFPTEAELQEEEANAANASFASNISNSNTLLNNSTTSTQSSPLFRDGGGSSQSNTPQSSPILGNGSEGGSGRRRHSTT